MDKAQFQAILSANNWSSADNLELLREASTQQPFFQLAEILYLAGLKQSSSANYDEELKRAAFLIPDRRFLFSFLKGLNKTAEIASEVDNSIPSEQVVVELEPNHEFELLGGETKTDEEVNRAATKLENDDILEFIADSSNFETEGDGLIDKFLNNMSSLQRPNKVPLPGEEVVLEDISLDSIVEPEEVATESLAEIYIQQRYFDKAIEVYKKLCLKYPEKSSYFAVQIEKINQGLNH